MRYVIQFFICCLLALQFPDVGFAQGNFQTSKPYIELSASLVPGIPGKIQVIEFFWYACPNCYAFEPALDRWISRLPSDVVFTRMPAVPNAQWGVAARVYFALDAIGNEKRVRRALLDAIHLEALRITDESAVTDWLSKHGVNAEVYAAAYHSFSVESNLERAAQMTRDYQIRSLGVPSIVVGRYITNADMTGSPSALLNVIDSMVAETRRELSEK